MAAQSAAISSNQQPSAAISSVRARDDRLWKRLPSEEGLARVGRRVGRLLCRRGRAVLGCAVVGAAAPTAGPLNGEGGGAQAAGTAAARPLAQRCASRLEHARVHKDERVAPVALLWGDGVRYEG